MPAAEAPAATAQVRSKAVRFPRKPGKNRCRSPPKPRSPHRGPDATGALQEPASQGQRKKTVRLSAHLSRASVPPEIADTTNHIRNRLSGGFFSSLLEGKILQIPDVLTDPEYGLSEAQRL